MVFENLTLFEINLDGAQFGPRAIGTSDSDDAAVDPTDVAASGGRGRFVAPLLVLGALGAGIVLLRRRARAGDHDVDIAFDEDEADLVAAE
ncbi:MAG: hypothetical protein ABEJ92_05265 [Halobacteriales archaeon]